MDYAAAGGCGTDGVEQLSGHDGGLHTLVLWMGIRNVREAAVLQIIFCGGSDLGSESSREHDLVAIFSIRSAGMGVAVADVLETAADATDATARASLRGADRGVAAAVRSRLWGTLHSDSRLLRHARRASIHEPAVQPDRSGYWTALESNAWRRFGSNQRR